MSARQFESKNEPSNVSHKQSMPPPEPIRMADAQAWLNHALIPQPSHAHTCPGTFILNSETTIMTDSLSASVALYLSETLEPATGFRLRIQATPPPRRANSIELRILSCLSDIGAEGYELSIHPDAIHIQAYRPAGLFYACQTLRQLLPKEILSAVKVASRSWIIPCVEIRDCPRFPWRGLMLDVARNFLSKAFILRSIDLLAFYKMNRLHLHLSDDTAWTLEIKKYPRLTDPKTRLPVGAKERGTYSQRDMREIIKYAAARHVMVIPEIEIPAHAAPVMSGYPELMCVNHPGRTGDSGHKEYCAGRDDVYDFINAVLSEVAGLFDAPYIHIGGDEYFGAAWEQCPDCRQRIQQEHLEAEDTPELQGLFRHCQGSPGKYLLYRYMMRRVANMVVAKNRIPILWDELAWRGDFPEKSVVMQWHYQGLHDWMQNTYTPANPAAEAARAGHDVIVASASHLYFNCCDGGALLQRVYDFEPVPQNLTKNQVPCVLGPHACMWEYPQKEIDGMLFPRLLAVAEQGWTSKPMRHWDHFAPRLQKHYPRLDILGIRYTIPPKNEGFPYKWNISKLTGCRKEWLINDVVTENGCYELTLHLVSGKETTTITVFWFEDGREPIPLSAFHPRNDLPPGNLVYRITVSGFRPHSLYYVRMLFTGDGQSDCSGEIIFKKVRMSRKL